MEMMKKYDKLNSLAIDGISEESSRGVGNEGGQTDSQFGSKRSKGPVYVAWIGIAIFAAILTFVVASAKSKLSTIKVNPRLELLSTSPAPISASLYTNPGTEELYCHLPTSWVDSGHEFLFIEQITKGVGIRELWWDPGSVLNQISFEFRRSPGGTKLEMISPNIMYRGSDQSSTSSFACSSLASFDILEVTESGFLFRVDDFLVSPVMVQDLAAVIASTYGSQYVYQLSADMSHVQPSTCSVGATSVALDVALTYRYTKGDAAIPPQLSGNIPMPSSISVSVRKTFLILPPLNNTGNGAPASASGFRLRRYHPQSGMNLVSFFNESAELLTPRDRHYIVRHNLLKPSNQIFGSRTGSQSTLGRRKVSIFASASFQDEQNNNYATKGLTYLIDINTPQPIRDALVEGISWWDEAFQYAGYPRGTFVARVADIGFDPYNLSTPGVHFVQWVNRNERSYSVGQRVEDPRTGQILRGHVRIGSLRMRQDALIAEALLGPFPGDDDGKDKSLQQSIMAAIMQRVKQLGAHEVGHTLGLAHNFASSAYQGPQGPGGVMDYPPPLVTVNADGELQLNNRSYANGIGFFDKVSIDYAYREMSAPMSEEGEWEALLSRLETAGAEGYRYLTDQDSDASGADWRGTRWDFGDDPLSALNTSLWVRDVAMRRLTAHAQDSVPRNYPLSYLQQILPVVYLWHRYEVEAVSKLLGGTYATIPVRGGASSSSFMGGNLRARVAGDVQRRALAQVLESSLTPPSPRTSQCLRVPLTAHISRLSRTLTTVPTVPTVLPQLLQCLRVDRLALTPELVDAIPHRAYGYDDGLGGASDLFASRTGNGVLDPVVAVETAAALTIGAILSPSRLERLAAQRFFDPSLPALPEVLHNMTDALLMAPLTLWGHGPQGNGDADKNSAPGTEYQSGGYNDSLTSGPDHFEAHNRSHPIGALGQQAASSMDIHPMESMALQSVLLSFYVNTAYAPLPAAGRSSLVTGAMVAHVQELSTFLSGMRCPPKVALECSSHLAALLSILGNKKGNLAPRVPDGPPF